MKYLLSPLVRSASGTTRARRVARSPLGHFFAAATLLFIGIHLIASTQPGTSARVVQRQINLSAAWLASVCRDELARSGSFAEGTELAALVRVATDDEILLREAIANGFQRFDPVVTARLVSNLRFVGSGDRLAAGQLLDQALALGMEQTDLVARRRLIGRMQLLIEGEARVHEPDPAELSHYLATHASRYMHPPILRLSHVYLSRTRRNDNPEGAGVDLVDRLNSEYVTPSTAVGIGDPFIEGRDLPPLTTVEIAKIFGTKFARATEHAPLRQWIGPLSSPYGVHAVWIHERRPARLPDLGAIRDRVRYDLLSDAGRARLAQRIKALRHRYIVRVVGLPLDLLLCRLSTSSAGATDWRSDCQILIDGRDDPIVADAAPVDSDTQRNFIAMDAESRRGTTTTRAQATIPVARDFVAASCRDILRAMAVSPPQPQANSRQDSGSRAS